jgi:hypothetical protein
MVAAFPVERAVPGGRTAIGRVTIELLPINDPFRVDFRKDLMAEGLFPAE